MIILSVDGSALRASFGEDGTLQDLSLDHIGTFLRCPRPGIWRLILRTAEDLEIPVLPEEQEAPVVGRERGTLTFTYPNLRCRLGTLDIALTLYIRLAGDELHWQMAIDNRAGVIVSEAWYPLIGHLRVSDDEAEQQALVWPHAAGIRILNPHRNLARYHSRYMGPDQIEVDCMLHYPSGGSMAWCDLCYAGEGLYLACYDETLRNGALLAMLEGQDLSLGYIKHPLITRGECWISPVYATVPHRGDWREGARRYRRWAEATWLDLPELPAWARHWLGWQRTILEHQYGELLWRYDQLPELYGYAQQAGFDTLHILGWWRGGMDNRYPYYEIDDRLGGEAALREGIHKVRAVGGKLIFYTNGHIIDPGTPFYAEKGHAISAKSIWGVPYREQYSFWGRGSVLRMTGQKQFSPACPSCPDWWELVEATARQVIDLGVDGLLIDQVGGCSHYLCFDASHPHQRPDEAFPPARNYFLAQLRRRIKAEHPSFVLMTEHVTDVFDQHFDMIHGCGPGTDPAPDSFPALFRYTFPEYVITNRNGGYDEAGYLTHANFAFLYGFRYDMSVYRCRGSLADLPTYTHYLRRMNDLRRELGDLLLAGRYVDHDYYDLAVEELQHGGYLGADGRLAVAVWNPTGDSLLCPAPAADRHVAGLWTLDGRQEPRPLVLGPQQIAVWVLDRAGSQ